MSTYRPVSTVQNLGIQSSAQKRMEDLAFKAQQLAVQDRIDAKQSAKLNSLLEDDLYSLRNQTMNYGFTDASGKFNIRSIKEKGLKFNQKTKDELIQKYRNKFNELGVPFNISNFEQSWQQGKIEENRRVLNDLNVAKSKGLLSDDQFNKALNDESFRSYFLSLTDEKNQSTLSQMGYNPLYISQKDRIEKLKRKYSLDNIGKQASELGIMSAENPFISVPAIAGSVYAAKKLIPAMGGTSELSKAEEILKQAESDYYNREKTPRKIKRPKKAKFKTEKAYKKAEKRWEARNKSIEGFDERKAVLKDSMEEARDTVKKLKSGKLYKGKKMFKSGVKGALPYMAIDAGGTIGEAVGGEEGELAGRTAGTAFLTFLKMKLPRHALKLAARVKMGHTAGLAGGPVGQGLALLADAGFTGWQLYELYKDYQEYLKTGKID